jgi:pimeloyl-ACP methyl ester carboxylesterase
VIDQPTLVSTYSVSVAKGGAPRDIAVRVQKGRLPSLVWLPGFMADMQGTKSLELSRWAAERGRACVHFDYSGHGQSGGEFRDGTITRWLAEAVTVLEECSDGPQILVGSSMGAWIALLAAREFTMRTANTSTSMAALVLLAPAVDMTEFIWARFPNEIRQQVNDHGSWEGTSTPGGKQKYIITRQLIEDGRKHLLLNSPIETNCPVRIIHGLKDTEAPWERSIKLASQVVHNDVELLLLKDSDHSLSKAHDISRLMQTVSEFT